jgi:hypothetical protein
MASKANRKTAKAEETPEVMPNIESIEVPATPEPAPKVMKFYVKFQGAARRTAHLFRNRMRNLFGSMPSIVNGMIAANEVMCETETSDNVTTIFVADNTLASRIFARVIENSLHAPTTLDDVMNEIGALQSQIAFFKGKPFAKGFDLETPLRVVAEVTTDVAIAIFDEPSALRALQLRVAEANDNLELASLESLEDSIIEIGAAKGLDTAVLRGQIEKVWANAEEPKKKLADVRFNLAKAPQQQPNARPLAAPTLRVVGQ